MKEAKHPEIEATGRLLYIAVVGTKSEQRLYLYLKV